MSIDNNKSLVYRYFEDAPDHPEIYDEILAPASESRQYIMPRSTLKAKRVVLHLINPPRYGSKVFGRKVISL